MNKKHKKILISLIALGAVSATALAGSLIACTELNRNKNLEYKNKFSILLTKIKSELNFLVENQTEEVIKFREFLNEVEKNSNKSTSFRDKYDELFKEYENFSSIITEYEKRKLINLINETKKLLEINFADQKYLNITSNVYKILEKNSVSSEEKFTSYISLIQSQNEIKNAIDKANKNKEIIDNEEQIENDKVVQDLQKLQDIFLDKVLEIKNEYLKNYHSLNDPKLNLILRPLNELVTNVLALVREMDLSKIDETTKILNDLTKQTVNNLNKYNVEKEKSLKNYRDNLAILSHLKNTLIQTNSHDLLDKVNSYLDTILNDEQLQVLSKEQLDKKAYEISIVVENVLLSIDEAKIKQEFLKNLYDNAYENELDRYNDYPEIKNVLKKSLDQSIENYINVFDINELDRRINLINKAITKAKNDLELLDNNTLYEEKLEQLRSLIKTIKENQLNNFDLIQELEIKKILTELNDLTMEAENNILNFNDDEINNKLKQLNEILNKTNTTLKNYISQKSIAFEKLIKAKESATKLLDSLTHPDWNEFKLDLSKVVQEANNLDKNTATLKEINDLTTKIKDAQVLLQNTKNNIDLRQHELKEYYDNLVKNELPKYTNYKDIYDELSASLDSVIENYKDIIKQETFNSAYNSMDNAVEKARNDLNKSLKDKLLARINEIRAEEVFSTDELFSSQNDELEKTLSSAIETDDKDSTWLADQLQNLNNTYSKLTNEADAIVKSKIAQFASTLSNLRDEENLEPVLISLIDVKLQSSNSEGKNLALLVEDYKTLKDANNKIPSVINLYKEINKAKTEVSNELSNKIEYKNILDNFNHIVSSLQQYIDFNQEQEEFNQNITQILQQLKESKDNALVEKYRLDIASEVTYWMDNNRLNNDFNYINSTNLANEINILLNNASNNTNYSLEQIKESFNSMNSKILEGYRNILNKLVNNVESQNYDYTTHVDLKKLIDEAKILFESNDPHTIQIKFTELKDEFERLKSSDAARLRSLERLKAKIKEANTFNTNTKDNERFVEIKTELKNAIDEASEGDIEILSQEEINQRLTALSQALDTAIFDKVIEEQTAEANKQTYKSIINQISNEETKIMYEPLYASIKTTMRNDTDAINTVNESKLDDLHSNTIANLNTKLNKILRDAKQAQVNKYGEIKIELTNLSNKFDEKYTTFADLVNADQWFANKTYSEDFKNKVRTYTAKMNEKANKYKEYLTTENPNIFTIYGYSRNYEFLLKFMEWFENVAAIETQDGFVDETKYAMLDDMLNTHYNDFATSGFRNLLLAGSKTSQNIRGWENLNSRGAEGYQNYIYLRYVGKEGTDMTKRDGFNEQLWTSNGLIPLIWNTQQWMDRLFSPEFVNNILTDKPEYKNELYNSVFAEFANDENKFVMKRWYSTKYLVKLSDFIENTTRYPEIKDSFSIETLI